MTEASVSTPFPRGALLGAAGLILLTITSAGLSQLTGGPQRHPAATVLMSRDLRFEDQPDGGVLVRDARDGSTVDVLAPGTNGFIRASLRSIAKRRRFDGESSDVFHLTAWADGRLTLDEPVTGSLIELEAFGQTNEMSFARLLTAGTQTR